MSTNKPLTSAMDNELARRIGEAGKMLAESSPIGYIDGGLLLLQFLNMRGFDVVLRQDEPATAIPEDLPKVSFAVEVQGENFEEAVERACVSFYSKILWDGFIKDRKDRERKKMAAVLLAALRKD